MGMWSINRPPKFELAGQLFLAIHCTILVQREIVRDNTLR
jgi:hypothetical protein